MGARTSARLRTCVVERCREGENGKEEEKGVGVKGLRDSDRGECRLAGVAAFRVAHTFYFTATGVGRGWQGLAWPSVART